MFIAEGKIPCKYFRVTKMISDILVEMGNPLLAITVDGVYCFADTEKVRKGIEELLVEYGDILERSLFE